MSLIDISKIEPKSLYVVFTRGGDKGTRRNMGVLLTGATVEENSANFLLAGFQLKSAPNEWEPIRGITLEVKTLLSGQSQPEPGIEFLPCTAVKLNEEPYGRIVLSYLQEIICPTIESPEEYEEYTQYNDFRYKHRYYDPDESLEGCLSSFLKNTEISFKWPIKEIARVVLTQSLSLPAGEVVSLRSMAKFLDGTGEMALKITD
ncbi:hypothetical protein DFH11DRAFT_1621723 [Phellopilus nigrolimitatus]|nr:hypothetical protein DFH11DRAFT_1621723 [Phellopilus nigrolimitatus]